MSPVQAEEITRDMTCWVLTDGKAGDEVQCLGIAEALDLTPERRHVAPRAPFSWAMPWGGIDPAEAPDKQGSPIGGPFPDLLIASGRRTVPYVRHVKKASGGKTFTVFLKDPRTGPGAADLIWVPEHDSLRANNVIATLTSPHRVSAARIAAARSDPPAFLASLPRPRVAVLAGGDSRHYQFGEGDIIRFLSRLEGLVDQGASLMMTASRRTPLALREGLAGLAARSGGYLWGGTGDNPYVSLLALADSVVVTLDSANMLSEAAATGRPLLVFTPSGGHPKFQTLLKGLEMCGIAQTFRGRLEGNAYLPLDTTEIIANAVVKALAVHRASLKAD